MASPIKPTPVLEGPEAREWSEKIEREMKLKVGPVPTPKLEALRQSLLKNGQKRSK